jgi:hypothetical protein
MSNPRQNVDISLAQSRFPSAFDHESGAVEFPPAPEAGEPATDLACTGALCAAFLGKHAGEELLETLGNHIMEHRLPSKMPGDPYELYFGRLAMFQLGGERWTRWNVTLRDQIVEAQRRDACFDGSWDPAGTTRYGMATGRVQSTAYFCLSLEIYYSYLPMARKVENGR